METDTNLVFNLVTLVRVTVVYVHCTCRCCWNDIDVYPTAGMRMSLHILCSHICWSDFLMAWLKIMACEHVDDKMFHKIPIYLY